MVNELGVISALIAALSAIYARYSYSQAKKSNQLVFHSMIKPIFVAFDELSLHMNSTGKFADKATVQKFLPYKREAEIYFDKKTNKYLTEYWDACFYMADLAGHCRSGITNSEQEIKIEEYQKVEKKLVGIIKNRIQEKLTVKL